MLRWAARGETKRGVVRKSEFSRSVTNTTLGIRATNVQNCGDSSTRGCIRDNRSGVFPLSNWTELNIWLYILAENIPVVPLYLAKMRPVVMRQDSIIMVDDGRLRMGPGEMPQMRRIRFRSLGCYPLSGAIESDAETLDQVVLEVSETRTSERRSRLIDGDHASSMERKKREGYF